MIKYQGIFGTYVSEGQMKSKHNLGKVIGRKALKVTDLR